MKKCKYCQTEIDKKAKICPMCKSKQGPKILRWIILGILIFLITSCVAGTDKAEESINKDYSQDQIIAYKGVEYSITKVEKTQGTSAYCKPSEGYEFVQVTVKVKNNGTEKSSFNSVDWQMVNTDGVEDGWGAFTCGIENKFSSGELEPGGTYEGVLVWEQKINDNNLRLRYYSNVLFDEEYTFQWKLN